MKACISQLVSLQKSGSVSTDSKLKHASHKADVEAVVSSARCRLGVLFVKLRHNENEGDNTLI